MGFIGSLSASTLLITPAYAQRSTDLNQNPIYIADSPIASDAMLRLPELIEQSNLIEATRLVDQTITQLGDLFIESQTPDLYIQVRDRLHSFVLEHPQLLEQYRIRNTPKAKAWLKAGRWQQVANDNWLTEPGFQASLYHAQSLIESAHFQSGARILTKLEAHPDADVLAKPAALLSRQVDQYINTDESRALYQRWSQRANTQSDPLTPIQTPEFGNEDQPTNSLVWNTNQTNQQISLSNIVDRPLGQQRLTPEIDIEHLSNQSQRQISGANWEPSPWAAPVSVGNLLLVNDGITISCFDRFTLRPIWRKQTAQDPDAPDTPTTPDARARLGRIIEDVTTITAVGNDLYVPTGIPRNGTRTGSNHLLKLDTRSGQTQWSISIDELDESLSNASIRGQIIVDQDTVLIGARTNNRKQRLINLAIIALDSATGNLRWIRQIASAGSLPFQQMGQLAHSPVLDQGIVYWTDHIGLAFAIESATGNVLWARPLPPPDLYARFTRSPFTTNTPAITPHGIFTLSTDGTQIIQLDQHTGKTIASRPALPVGEALYVLPINDQIASVSQSQIVFYQADRFAESSAIRTETLGDSSGIKGRVLSINNQLLVPVNEGVLVIDPDSPSGPKVVSTIELDHSGNILAHEGQLVVVDELNISSFLAWETASRLLKARIEHDPGSAITLAELAFRAQQTDAVVPEVLNAISVVGSLPIAQRATMNNQLFQAIHDMLSTDPRPTNQQTTQPQSKFKLASEDQRTLLGSLGSLAQSHDQVVAHRMAQGAWHEIRNENPQAIAAYQDILDQPSLRVTMWEGSGIAVRGGLEASRRIGNMLKAQGYTNYRTFDQLALSEHSFLATDPSSPIDLQSLEQLAQRYPWSTITPSIWLSIADTKASNQIPASINAAIEGIEVTRSLAELGVSIDQSTIDQLAERAITGMIQTNRSMDAQTLAQSLTSQFPNLTLQIAGETITHDEIAQRARLSTQRPKLNDAFIRDDSPLLLTGSPIIPATRIDPGGIIMYAPQLGKLEYVRAGRNVFETIWSRQSMTNEIPIIPWQDETRTLIYYPDGTHTKDTGTLEAIETTTGRVIWSLNDVFINIESQSDRSPDGLARVETQFSTPAQGIVPIQQMLITTDGHTVVASDRIGRAIGIDLFSGEELWRTDLPTNRVYDIDINSGVLGICGVMYTDEPNQQHQGSSVSIAASIDPRSGETIQVIERFGQFPSWVRVANNGNLFVATSERIVAINTEAGSIDWVLNDDMLVESPAGWISGDQLYVLDGSNELWSLSLNEGTRDRRTLDTRRRIARSGWIQAKTLMSDFVIASPQGFVSFDQNQELAASDPINTTMGFADIAWGADHIVLIEEMNILGDDAVCSLHLISNDHAELLDTINLRLPASINRQPTSIAAINGGLIVGFNEVSVFVRTTNPQQ